MSLGQQCLLLLAAGFLAHVGASKASEKSTAVATDEATKALPAEKPSKVSEATMAVATEEATTALPAEEDSKVSDPTTAVATEETTTALPAEETSKVSEATTAVATQEATTVLPTEETTAQTASSNTSVPLAPETTMGDLTTTEAETTTVYCSKLGSQCGGKFWKGPVICCEGTCTKTNGFYSKCSNKSSCAAEGKSCGGNQYFKGKDCCPGFVCQKVNTYAPGKCKVAPTPAPVPAPTPVPAATPAFALRSLQSGPASAAALSTELCAITMLAACTVALLIIFLRSRMRRAMGLEEPLLMA